MPTQWRGLVASVLFPCPSPSYSIDSFPGELIWIPRGPVGVSDASENGETVPCLMLPLESARFIVLFFHSNAEDLGRCRWFCHFLRDQFEVHVLAVEYPGYGCCPGPPSREGVIANALAGLNFVRQGLRLPLDRIKVFGRSIGTAPALQIAARFKVSGVILVTPFLSIRSLFKDRVGPLACLVDEWFENDKEILKVQSPTMFIHGRRDVIIPFRHGEALYRACTTRKLFINPAAMEHNTNLTNDVSYLIVPMFRFFALPDYSFQELKVPSWAYDKRRSPYYRRPMPEVSFGSSAPRVGPGLATAFPEGDDELAPMDQDLDSARRSPRDLRGKARLSRGDQPAVDLEKYTALTHPTVRHIYRATKQRYNFNAPAFDGMTLTPEEGAEASLHQLRCWPVGNHIAAVRVGGAGASRGAAKLAAARQHEVADAGGAAPRDGTGANGPASGAALFRVLPRAISRPAAADASPRLPPPPPRISRSASPASSRRRPGAWGSAATSGWLLADMETVATQPCAASPCVAVADSGVNEGTGPGPVRLAAVPALAAPSATAGSAPAAGAARGGEEGPGLPGAAASAGPTAAVPSTAPPVAPAAGGETPEPEPEGGTGPLPTAQPELVCPL